MADFVKDCCVYSLRKYNTHMDKRDIPTYLCFGAAVWLLMTPVLLGSGKLSRGTPGLLERG